VKLGKLAEMLGAELAGDEGIEIVGVAGIREAAEGHITFISDSRQVKDIYQSRASAVIVPLDAREVNLPHLRVKNPRLAFTRALSAFYVSPYKAAGVSVKAVIAGSAVIGSDVSIHPCAVVDEDARIGDRVTLYPGVYVGKGSSVGDDSVIHANVSIGPSISIGKRVIMHAGAVLGSDGFGFVTEGGVHHKIPQTGGVVVEDDVEIGGNCTIDRATLGNTVIKKGTKLDNQVHIAHNVTIGEHCLLAGQVGIAGSSTLGNYVVFGGQAGVSDHTVIGDRVMAGGKAVITRDVAAGSIIAGFNAMPLREWLRVQAVLPKLPELKKKIADLEKQISVLQERLNAISKGEQS
jgi:UDP-3-O-[3-hydroxymyristoyl] glucosamine N-acyltransferase